MYWSFLLSWIFDVKPGLKTMVLNVTDKQISISLCISTNAVIGGFSSEHMTMDIIPYFLLLYDKFILFNHSQGDKTCEFYSIQIAIGCVKFAAHLNFSLTISFLNFLPVDLLNLILFLMCFLHAICCCRPIIQHLQIWNIQTTKCYK